MARLVTPLSTLLAYGAATSVNISVGCPQYGCDPSTSFTSSLCAPRAPSDLTLTPFNASGSAGLGSLSCITSSSEGVCTCPQPAADNSTVMGLCGVALTRDSRLQLQPLYLYTGLGAGRCTTPMLTAQRGVFNAPIMNVVGDMIAWDAYHAAYVSAGGVVQWTTSIAPAAPCPDATMPISITGRSTLVLVNAADAEVATIFPNGLPEAYITLEANSTRYIPIAQQSVAYNRMLLLTRAYDVMASQELIPTATLALTAVDQTYSPVQRLQWAWTLPLPFNASACVPAPAGVRPGDETTLSASNSLVGDATDTLLFAVACDGVVMLTSVNVSTAAAAPVVQWTSKLPIAADGASPLQLARGFDAGAALLVVTSPASVTKINVNDGSLAWTAGVQSLLAPTSCGTGSVVLTGAAVVAAGNCSGFQGLPQLLLPASVAGAPQLVSLTLPAAPSTNVTVQWCQALPSPAVGQVTLLSSVNADNSTSPAVLLTTTTGMLAIA